MPGPITQPRPISPVIPNVPTASTPTVREAERLLKRAGFSPGTVDGKTSPALTKALQEFQAAWGLPTSGAPDARTMAKLRHTGERIADHRKEKDGFVSVGQKSDGIKTIERRLQTLGYDVGKVDGIYSRETAAAVKAFKADQPDIRNTSGAIAEHGRKVLRDEVRALAHDPQRRRLDPTKAQRILDTRTAKAAMAVHANGEKGLGEGSKGPAVENVQKHLRAAGYDPQHTNGVFDERTAGALKAFQRQSGLEPSGRVDAQTWKRLKTSFILSSHAAAPAQARGEHSAEVKQSEKLLQKLGFNPGKVDGVFDARTEKAVKAFEKKHGLERDGEIGTNQLAQMKKLAAKAGGIQVTNEMRRLVANGKSVALSMGGYSGLGLCATGVSRAIERTMGFKVWGNGNQIDNNLPRAHFRQVNLSLAEALKIPGLVLTWERTSSALGQKYGHTAITTGDGRSSTSDFIERNTLGAYGRTGLKVFVPLP
ncbi:MAG: peptidoglycan-binding protein [Myxococcales bacterium]|nr:peptidoglycan-binding protein [Myxococcales bacterium]